MVGPWVMACRNRPARGDPTPALGDPRGWGRSPCKKILKGKGGPQGSVYLPLYTLTYFVSTLSCVQGMHGVNDNTAAHMPVCAMYMGVHVPVVPAHVAVCAQCMPHRSAGCALVYLWDRQADPRVGFHVLCMQRAAPRVTQGTHLLSPRPFLSLGFLPYKMGSSPSLVAPKRRAGEKVLSTQPP